MDFYKIRTKTSKNGVEAYPDFQVIRSKDLMLRGRSFYAIWDEKKGLWSTDEYDVARLVDEELQEFCDDAEKGGEFISPLRMGDFKSSTWRDFRSYIGLLSDSSTQLDEELAFSNTEVKKSDFVSKRLPYPLSPGSCDAYDELVSTLYDPEERDKLEWAVGAVIAGDAKHIQKFLVLYGSAGTGKSTFLNIVQKLFEGYYTTFEAKALTSGGNSFSTEVFRDNPLVAIQHDGDLSKIEDNTKLNSIISHEDMTLNEKFKPSYMAKINAFLFMGTNKPVKITDAKSGIIRRLIDVHPSGRKVPRRRYDELIFEVDFELGAIAYHCLQKYRQMGKNYYAGYRPVEMMLQTDIFFNFIEANYDVFSTQDGTTLKQAYELYKVFCEEALVEYKLPRHRFRDELRNYFEDFNERVIIDDIEVRSWYSGFKRESFTVRKVKEEASFSLVLDSNVSLLDEELEDMPAQYTNAHETPQQRWIHVETKLKDIDTSKLHYVKVPKNHIVIDFDLKNEDGQKDAGLNFEAASKWPPTYAELSKGGAGIHLHYIYEGDATQLDRVYSEGIEIKVFTGDSSLRRRLSKCNNVPIATINSGLPLKEKRMIDSNTIKSEKGLRELIERNLRKEIHPGTKPSIDFIVKILDDAYSSGMSYDVSDMRNKILNFAGNSTNQAEYCMKAVVKMKFKSETLEETAVKATDDRIVFFDVEVFPNLFIVCWKYDGSDQVVRMINPSPVEIEELCKMKLVGFNCRRYDNHILYGRIMGYNNEQLYKLSQKIIGGSPNALFGEAYSISYADIFDFSSKKQTLKKFEIDLGINHMELDIPWDEPVPEDLWEKVADYCANDVEATEATFHARIQDYNARVILSDLSGLPVNATTAKQTAKIIFGNDRDHQEKFVYTDLSEEFPGYTFDMGKSHYKGYETGEGGFVYAEPGMYENVALLDIASMHPTSAVRLNIFGPYTKNFEALMNARLAIKHGEYDEAKKMLGDKIDPYLQNEDDAEALSYALKIVINTVYGLTSAKFDNPFRDKRNKDNIVAKRGSLFMVDLLEFVKSEGFTVAHIKTDSIKIPNATPEIIDAVMEFGEKYGYTFEHEATYDRFCLVNDAVYIAKVAPGRKPAYWAAVGAQFQHPYVYKTLFSKEPVEFKDLCEVKSVTTALYLDFEAESPMYKSEEDKHFVGKIGQFVPIKEGCGGAVLLREKEGRFYAAGGTKGYFWLEASMVKELGKEKDIDMSYFESLVFNATEQLKKYGDVEWFLNSST